MDFFPTPKELAAKLVKKADVQNAQFILEPSAGNGHCLYPEYSGKNILTIDNQNNIIESKISDEGHIFSLPELYLNSVWLMQRPRYEIDKFDINCQIFQKCEMLAAAYQKINPNVGMVIYIYILGETIFPKDKNVFGSEVKLNIMITEDRAPDQHGLLYRGLCCFIPSKVFWSCSKNREISILSHGDILSKVANE